MHGKKRPGKLAIAIDRSDHPFDAGHAGIWIRRFGQLLEQAFHHDTPPAIDTADIVDLRADMGIGRMTLIASASAMPINPSIPWMVSICLPAATIRRRT